MKRSIYLFVFIISGLFSYVHGQGHWVGIDQPVQAPAEIHLAYSSIRESIVHISLDGYLETPMHTPHGTEVRVGIGNGPQIMEAGMPDLAKLTTNLIIPDIEEMTFQVVSAKYHEFTGVEVAPSKGHFTRDIRPEDVPYTYGDAYETDAFWPGELARLEDPFIMRDFRGQTLSIFPYQYNPVTQTLRVYYDMIIEVVTTDKEGQDPLTRKRDMIEIEPEFGQIYGRFFLNLAEAGKSYPMTEGEEGSLLIIAYDDFTGAMQAFVDWKRTIGRKTEMVPKSAAGNTANAIKNFIADYYEKNEDLAYLLLVGDGPQIPPMTTSSGHSDNAYGFLVGNNSFNDIFVGRFSAENIAHVETQVQRMIEYERDLNQTDTWLNTAMGIARNEGAGIGHHGESDYQHMDFIKDTLLNFTYEVVHRNYDGNVPGLTNTTAAEISANINNGVSAINFCNHGSVTGWSVASYNINHVNQLTNTGRLPYITSVACVNGDFVNNFSFSEAWMRATHNGEPAGAVGIMASTINQPWQPPMCGQDEMASIKTGASIPHGPTIKRTYGGISTNGSMFMIPQYGSEGIETHETWILFGDPTLMVRTDVPEPFTPTYHPVALLGVDHFTVAVPDADGSRVAISHYNELEEEVVILGTAAVEGGTATVYFDEPPVVPGILTLAITGLNKTSYINNEINLIPPDGPYVILDQFIIDDSQGNNNQQADYGEFISLDIVLKNVGIEPAGQVEASLFADSEYVTILDNHFVFGDIEENASLAAEGAFSFKVDSIIPDKHNILFTLDITDAEGHEWESLFALRIYSPQFNIGEFWVDDSAHGDGNGRLDPGETASIKVPYTNTGGAPAMAPVSKLIAVSPYLTIVDERIEHAVIQPGETKEVSYAVEAHASTIEGTFVDILFHIQDAQEFEASHELVIGQVPESVLGEGGLPSQQYPFYNYYRANRSQMLYRSGELGEGAGIAAIAFDIIQTSSVYNDFPNFVIRMMHTSQGVLSGFLNTSDATEVFVADTYTMPQETGWHAWELDEVFEYNGQDNLLVEIVWGRLNHYTMDHYKVASTDMGSNLVAYGYSDFTDIPSLNGTSRIRPNLLLSFATGEPPEEHSLSFSITNQDEQLLENANVRVGSLDKQTGPDGLTSFNLLPGNYTYTVSRQSYLTRQDEALLINDTLIEVRMLLASYPVTFNVDVSRAIEFNLLEGFDPDIHHVFLTGDMIDWAEPGSDPASQVMEQSDVDPAVFTITRELSPGSYAYKYFSDAIGQGWDGGEWAGEPNRLIEVVDQEMVVNELFGPDDLQVIESGDISLTIYPNPARSRLYVRSNGQITGIRLISIPGQVVYDATVPGTNQHEINVSGLRTGIYLVQVITTGGVITHRVQISE